MKKRIVAALMASVMCLSMLAGCGNNDDGTQGGNSGSSEGSSSTPVSSTPTESTPDASQPSGGEEPSGQAWEQTWPDGQKITWLVRDDNVDPADSRYQQLIGVQKIEEMFHVDIEFIIFNGKADDAKEQYLTMLTTEPLPDVISYLNEEMYKADGGITGLKTKGIIPQSLNEIIETKMPNLSKILEDRPDIARDLSDNNGEYLYFERINPYDSATDYVAASDTGLVMRKDWLDDVGMDVPTNMDEWYDVLTAFKQIGADKVPFDAYSSGIMLFEAAYGMTSGIYIDPDTGKVEHGARTQKYKEYLETMSKWYAEGLMDHVFDENGKAVSKGGDDNVTGGIAGSWKGLANNNTKFGDKMREAGQPQVELVAVPWPAMADGTVYTPRTVSRKQRETQIITVDAKAEPEKMDAIATVMDYMFSEEGSEMLCWGEEGVTFVKDDMGNRTLTEYGNEQLELPGNTGKPQRYKMYGNQSGGFPSYGCFDVNSATRDQWFIDAATVWVQASFDLGYPGCISLTAEQNEKVNEGNSQLSDYIAEMKWKFITGQEPLSNFDTYVAELERMGISNVVAAYQEAYDAYLAK